MRAFAVRALKLRGFDVDEAESGEEALEMVAQADQHYGLYISDIIMPGIDGPGWVEQALKRTPETRVIFVSGYAEDALQDNATLFNDARFLPKPFSLSDLVQATIDSLEIA